MLKYYQIRYKTEVQHEKGVNTWNRRHNSIKKHNLGLRPELEIDELIKLINIRGICSLEGMNIMNIDSTNMTHDKWFVIANHIKEHYQKFDGFVITHGTDTMAYTAAALTYIFHNLNKPVIITGSQYPITEFYTDGIQILPKQFILLWKV